MTLEIAAATLADLDAIQEIERHSFPTPWPRTTFEAELARDHARLIVAVDRQHIVGWCNFWIVVDEVHILAIATHPDRRRAGIGARLVARALADGRAARCTVATLEVRHSNVPAIALYEAAGFTTIAVRARYYQDNQEDALVMRCSLSE
jgi:[ribosomal protein S18]-alanine N-acetyltransferase